LETNPTPAKAIPEVGFHVLRHYLKDLSFENPHGTVRASEGGDGEPALDVDGTVSAHAESDPAKEGPRDVVELTLTITGRYGQHVAFLCELTYVAEVQLENIPDLVRPQILHVNVPEYLVPAVNNVIGRIAELGGYPGLHVVNRNFLKDFNQVRGGDRPKRRPTVKQA